MSHKDKAIICWYNWLTIATSAVMVGKYERGDAVPSIDAAKKKGMELFENNKKNTLSDLIDT